MNGDALKAFFSKEIYPQFKLLQYETGMFRNEQNGACQEH